MNKPRSRSYFIFELHVLNLPLAFFLKLFGNVFVFRYKGYCKKYLRSKTFSSMQDFTGIDQWLEQKELVYKTIKGNLEKIESLTPSYSCLNHRINLKQLFVQQFSIDYEWYRFYICLIQNHQNDKKIIINSSIRQFIKLNLPHLLQENHPSIDFMPNVFEILYRQIEVMGKILRTVLLFLKKTNPDKKNYKCICTGISPAEYPTNENTLNFAWLVINQIVKAEEILYLLDAPPEQEAIKFLKNLNINFITKKEYLSRLDLKRKFYLLNTQAINSLKHFFNLNYSNTFLVRSFFASSRLGEVFLSAKPQHFIYSLSEGWPEPAESSLANAMNINTVLWFYSAGEFLASHNFANYKDFGIRFTCNEARQLWVWNNLLKKLIKARMFNTSKTEIFAVGPILNGDWKHLKEEIGTQFTIAFFDITPVNARNRLNVGEGPFCNANLQEKFYETVYKIYEFFPDTKIIIKTKRSFDPFVFDRTESLEKLKQIKSKRLIFEDQRTDPYITIAKANLVISVPITSPSMLSLALKKPGAYYNPLNTTCHSFENAFSSITIQNEEELFNYIDKIKNQNLQIDVPNDFLFEFANLEKTKIFLRNRLL